MILGIIATILSGRIALLAGVVGGAVLGGIVGTFVHKGLGISHEDLKRIGDHLDVGRAAVGVMIEKEEVSVTSDELTKLGGKIETYEVSAEALWDATKAAAEAPSGHH